MSHSRSGVPFPAPRIAESTVEVRSHELDSFGHVNHAVFLNYMEYGRFEALRTGGFSYDELQRRGWGVYVVRIEADYLREARLGQRLRIRTRAESHTRSTVVFAQEIALADDPASVLVRASVTAVWVGSDRKPMRLPPEVHLALSVVDAATSRDP